MKRIAIATALTAALIIPAFAVSATDTGNTQDVTITVNKAIEGSSAATVSLSGSPSGSGNVNVDSGSVAAVALRSNAAWTGSISAPSTTMNENDARSSGSLANALLYGTTASPVSTLPASPTQVGSGARNSDNNTQNYNLYFRQPISWADEIGDYKITVTHDLSN